MCLFLKPYAKSKKTKFTHTYYKVLLDHGNNIYETPFQYTHVELCKILEAGAIDQPIPIEQVGSGETAVRFVSEGAFHLFKCKRSAKRICEDFEKGSPYLDAQYVVVKAIVPKGTYIIKGVVNHSNVKSICTKRVIYKPLKG